MKRSLLLPPVPKTDSQTKVWQGICMYTNWRCCQIKKNYELAILSLYFWQLYKNYELAIFSLFFRKMYFLLTFIHWHPQGLSRGQSVNGVVLKNNLISVLMCFSVFMLSCVCLLFLTFHANIISPISLSFHAVHVGSLLCYIHSSVKVLVYLFHIRSVQNTIVIPVEFQNCIPNFQYMMSHPLPVFIFIIEDMLHLSSLWCFASFRSCTQRDGQTLYLWLIKPSTSTSASFIHVYTSFLHMKWNSSKALIKKSIEKCPSRCSC